VQVYDVEDLFSWHPSAGCGEGRIDHGDRGLFFRVQLPADDIACVLAVLIEHLCFGK
jgi:hypothetical protein